MSEQQTALSIDAELAPDAYTIRVQGRLDRAGCLDLDLALGQAEQAEAGRIVLDLDELTFIDSNGLKTLLDASRRSASNGNRLELTRGKGHPAEMLRLLALGAVQPLTDRSVPDDSDRPRTGEEFLYGAT